LRRFFKNVSRREIMMEFACPSKEAHMIAMEMPRMLEHFLHRFELRKLKGPEDGEGAGGPAAESAKA
jgi:hypothetical protein